MKTILKTATVVALLTSGAAFAQADRPAKKTVPAALSTEEGWNSQWSLLFGLSDFFTNGNFLESTAEGSVSGEYYLSEDTGLRIGATLVRSSDPVVVTKFVDTSGGNTTTTYTFDTGSGDFYRVGLSADYIKRLSTYSVAPYVGAGVAIGWTWSRWAYIDDVSQVDRRILFNRSTMGFGVDLRALLGAEWRVHPNFALYADYAATLTLINSTLFSQRTTTEVGTGTPATSDELEESARNTFLTVNTGVSQGFSLGLKVFF